MNKRLLKIALRYIEKGYNSEQLKYGDDLYSFSEEEKNECIDYFYKIEENGTNWAYEELNK
jgi:hypothetical protein